MTTIAGFKRRAVRLPEITLSVQEAGQGAPLILLHGYPENGMCWSRVAAVFAARYRVIIPDLRGYGESAAPPDDQSHTAYSKRQMALDIVALMDALEIPQAMILGHDRGARVTYRLALDHPARVSRIGIIEIAPTSEYWAAWNAEMAMAAYHWTFLSQPAPLPDRLINSNPEFFVDTTLASWTSSNSLDAFPADALESYRVQARDPARVTALCADYRAGITTDRRLDLEDQAAGRKIEVPLQFLWSREGFSARTGDPAAIWRRWAKDVRDISCESGHFVMEENPQAVLDAFLPFLAGE